MQRNRVIASVAALGLALVPVLASAQEISITRSVLTNLPFTLIYPANMQASGGGDAPLTINHTSAPLQCDMSVVPVEDTDWTAEEALGTVNDAEIATSWADALPGFAITEKGTVAYQDATALTYEGTSTDSAMGMPLTLVHTEAVASGRGYVLDCIYATEQAEQARPIVDFIIANFSTRADADCCIGAEVEQQDDEAVAQ